MIDCQILPTVAELDREVIIDNMITLPYNGNRSAQFQSVPISPFSIHPCNAFSTGSLALGLLEKVKTVSRWAR